MRPALVITVLAISAINAGCIPVSIPDNPEINGRIVDASTHTPILGAAIVVNKSGPRNTVLATSLSDNDGSFVILGAKHTQWIPVAYDLFLPPITIKADAAGYNSSKVEISPWQPWNGTIELFHKP